jgi:hypothetical protein
MPYQDSSFFAHLVTAGKVRYIKRGPKPPACCQFQSEMVTIEQGEGGQAKDLLIIYFKKSSAE